MAENWGVRQTALRAPAIRSAGVRIPNFFQERTSPLQLAHFQSDAIPQAPRMAIMGVALNMKRAAFQAMKVAAKTQTPKTRSVERRWRSPLHRNVPPITRASRKVIGPKEAKSCARFGAFASAMVPKILVFVKYPLPVKRTSHASEIPKVLRMNSTTKKIVAMPARVPRTSNQGLSR